ncbi:MAG: phosphoribosylformylglycinamidine cyclo-ligase [Anaerolineae bacterium]
MAEKRSAYEEAGVDIDAKMNALKLMTAAVKSTYGPEVLAGMGSFGGLYSAQRLLSMRDPVLVASTDSVGTKVMLGAQAGRYDVLGEDIVNHGINDILVQGAEPLFFLDYIAMPHVDAEAITAIVAGMARGCRAAGCAILGGETAELPGVYQPAQFDVVGTIVGLVERDQIIDGAGIIPGDQLIGLPSSGPHTNGYTLIRKVFAGVGLDHVYPELGMPLADAVLAPHRSYLDDVRRLRSGVTVKGLVHITGGGFYDNIPRILPEGVAVTLWRDSWAVPPLFRLIAELGDVDLDEMHRVFNMGMGMVAVVPAGQLRHALSLAGPGAAHIGEVVARREAAVTLV